MPTETHTPVQNKLLAALPAEEYERLLPHLTPVTLPLGEVLYSTGDHIQHAYFVSTGVVSFVTHMQDGASVEVGLVGLEGTVGIGLALGDDRAPSQAIVQLAASGVRIVADVLREELKRGGHLQSLLLRCAQALMRQVSQTAACNRSHHIGERLARWLLTCHDRAGGDELRLTQEFVAEMLGVRRAGVTEAAIILQSSGLIRYARGHVTILDRAGLEEFSCECYGVVKAEFDRLLGQ